MCIHVYYMWCWSHVALNEKWMLAMLLSSTGKAVVNTDPNHPKKTKTWDTTRQTRHVAKRRPETLFVAAALAFLFSATDGRATEATQIVKTSGKRCDKNPKPHDTTYFLNASFTSFYLLSKVSVDTDKRLHDTKRILMFCHKMFQLQRIWETDPCSRYALGRQASNFPRISTWLYMALHGSSSAWLCMVKHGYSWFFFVLLCRGSRSIVIYSNHCNWCWLLTLWIEKRAERCSDSRFWEDRRIRGDLGVRSRRVACPSAWPQPLTARRQPDIDRCDGYSSSLFLICKGVQRYASHKHVTCM